MGERVDLKPCPFCGGDAEVRFSGKQYRDYWRGYFVVGCTVCSATVCGQFYEGEPIEDDMDETAGSFRAAQRWNIRKGENNDAQQNHQGKYKRQ